MFSQQMAQALLAGADVLKCIQIEISFKFIPKILMSKECIHFFGPLCIYFQRGLQKSKQFCYPEVGNLEITSSIRHKDAIKL
jgi:hypothetical protein